MSIFSPSGSITKRTIQIVHLGNCARGPSKNTSNVVGEESINTGVQEMGWHNFMAFNSQLQTGCHRRLLVGFEMVHSEYHICGFPK